VRQCKPALTVQFSGSPLKVLKESANNFLVVTSFRAAMVAAAWSPIRRKFFFLQSFKIQQGNVLLLFSLFYRSANVLFHLFARKPVKHVMNQSKQQTLSFIVCRCRRGLGSTVARKFSIEGFGLCVCAGGLDILKIDKTPLMWRHFQHVPKAR